MPPRRGIGVVHQGGDVAKLFDSGYMTRTWTTNEEQIYSEEAILHTWGRIIGMHGSEELALAALDRNEIVEVENKTKIGPKTLFKVVEITGHH